MPTHTHTPACVKCGNMPGIRLRSAPARRRSTTEPGDCVVYDTESPVSHDTAQVYPLGACDVAFTNEGKPPVLVDILVVVPLVLDVPAFVAATKKVVKEDFHDAGGSRNGHIIYADSESTVRITHVDRGPLSDSEEERLLHTSQDLSELFDAPRSEVMALKLTTTSRHTAIGLVFDHALCDLGGAALFLAHISARYRLEMSPGCTPLPPRPHHDRSLQRSSVAGDEHDASSASRHFTQKGGAAIVEFEYSDGDLQQLKASIGAVSRHDAVLADVIGLLREAGHPHIETASISRDDRKRLGLPREHFGNGTLICVARLPPAIAGERGVSMRSAISGAIRTAVETGAATAQWGEPADLHSTSWWHPLQQVDLTFGAAERPHFDIGPSTLAVATRMCGTAGRPNLSILPGPRGGFKLSLRAPLRIAHEVTALLRQRAKRGSLGALDCNAVVMPTDGRPPSAALGECSVSPAVPAGHTLFSWLGGGLPDSAVPPSHTAFSWRATSTSDGCHPPREDMQAAPRRCALLWLHGLGGEAHSWEVKLRTLDALVDDLRRRHPTAAMQPVTSHGGNQLAAWFDLQAYPVGIDEPSVDPMTAAPIHRMLDQLVLEEGLRSDAIVIGGFSQGGAAALLAGLTYHRPLAGIVAVSGWCTHRDQTALAALVNPLNARVPVFISCGTADPVVSFHLARQSADVLRGALLPSDGAPSRVTFERVDRAAHMPKSKEMQAAIAFIHERLHSGGTKKLLTKGERALLSATAPNVSSPVPTLLTGETKVRFDPELHPFRSAVMQLLTSLGSSFGAFAQPSLEQYRPVEGAFTSFRHRHKLYNAAARDEPLLAVYDAFIERVIAPFLKSRLADAGNEDAMRGKPIAFHYQRPPSIRLQPPDPHSFCRVHRDAEYGHQEGELNFWMPITDPSLTQTTLWTESRPEEGDFHPLQLAYGDVAMFHGTLCRHKVPPNMSRSTRVSLDFRVGIGPYFDAEWKLPEAKAQHTRRLIRL